MANPQLVDYIKGQLAAGVSKEAIMGALRAAGWAEADITESAKSVDGDMPAMQPGAKDAAVGQKPASAVGATKASAVTVASFSPAKTFADDGGKKMMDISAGGKVTAQNDKAEEFPPKSMPMSRSRFSLPFKKGWIMPSVFGAVIVALLAGLGWLYQANAGLSSKISGMETDAAAAQNGLNVQVQKLNGENSDLTSKLADANAAAADLAMKLSFFIIPAGDTAASVLPVDIKGAVGASKLLYTLTTDDGIVVTIKNSGDAMAAAALKPLMGKTTEITGTHLAGSREITAETVAGASVQQEAASSTPSASSTAP